jgi:hypothetical protein
VDHVPGGTPYDVAPDGRILVDELPPAPATTGGAPDTSSFAVVLNFTSGL